MKWRNATGRLKGIEDRFFRWFLMVKTDSQCYIVQETSETEKN